MRKLILLHGEQSGSFRSAILQKYHTHICNPILVPLLGKPTDELVEVCNDLSKTAIYLVEAAKCDDQVEEKFNTFNVWSKPIDLENNPHKSGIWIADASEIDFLFNMLIPWVFD